MSSHLDYEINKELGECYLFMGELDKAEGYYQKAMNSNKELIAPYLGLATIAMQKSELDKAFTLYSEASKLEGSDKALAGLGLVLFEKQDILGAFNKFCESLQINAANNVALACIVKIAYMENKINEIIPYLERAIAVENKSTTRITLSGCMISLDRHEEAIAILEKLMQEEPDNFEAQELLDHIRV